MSSQHDKVGCTSICPPEKRKLTLWSKRYTFVVVGSAVLLTAGLLFNFMFGFKLLAQILFLVTAGISGHQIIKDGLISLIKKRVSINFLMTIAAGGAFLIGHGEEGAAVIFLFFLAESLEDYAQEKTKKSIVSLIETAPDKAVIKQEGGEIEVEVEKVKVGSVVVIRPGDKIPVDGVVTGGFSSANQAPITGESAAVSKEKGEEVFAGSINGEGYLEVKVTKSSHQTTLAKMVNLVEEARKKKSATEKFIDRFATFYTPAVIIFALAVATVPTLLFGLPFNIWIYRALVLLVVSCPCALAISTPVSMISGITSGAKKGILVKGGSYIEEIRKVKAVAFDKTGTLTLGKPEVTGVFGLNGYSPRQILQLAASLESSSQHPIAQAIVNKARKEKVGLEKVENFQSITGKGIKGQIKGKSYYIGNRNFFLENGALLPSKIEQLENKGITVIVVGDERQVFGAVTLMDEPREDAKELIKILKKRGTRTVMLTGDNKPIAHTVADKIGIDEYYAQLLPEDKVRVIDELLEKYQHVVMVGDGVNDAPALAKAHVGIAMGAAGSDVAIETADVALMQDELLKVDYLIQLSKRTMRVVRQNTLASIIIKGSFAGLAFPGIITLWLAVAIGDMGLSLAVILNALRIGRK